MNINVLPSLHSAESTRFIQFTFNSQYGHTFRSGHQLQRYLHVTLNRYDAPNYHEQNCSCVLLALRPLEQYESDPREIHQSIHSPSNAYKEVQKQCVVLPQSIPVDWVVTDLTCKTFGAHLPIPQNVLHVKYLIDFYQR